MENVLAKVKKAKNPFFSERSPESQATLAEELIDPAKVKERFSHLLDVEDEVTNIMEAAECELTHSLEVNKCREREKRNALSAHYLPVKLFLSKLRREMPSLVQRFATHLRFAFGPLHAGLMVGDVQVEWDDSSLIVPMPADDVPKVDFMVQMEGLASLQAGIGEGVRNMSLANRRHMETPEKLKIIYQGLQQKEQLIDNLVQLIVDYNKSKNYGVFRCNCQHFVDDALKILRVDRSFEFGGNLGRYFEELKRGKVSDHRFGSHLELDAYVKDSIQVLDQREMEYLLCLYFQLHSKEIKFLSPEEQDAWRCPVKTCKSEDLEYIIQSEPRLLDKYKSPAHHPNTLPVPSNGATCAPSRVPSALPIGPARAQATSPSPLSPFVHVIAMPMIEEEAVDSLQVGGIPNSGVPEKLLKDTSVADQEQWLARYSGYRHLVFVKLQGLPEYSGRDESSLKDEIDKFSEREWFRKAYFSKYIDDTSAGVVLETSSQSRQDLHSPEIRRRAAERFEKMINIDMNLIVRASSTKQEGGGLSAARAPVACGLQVGNFCFAWDETSLVVPLDLEVVETTPHIFSPVQPESKWNDEMEKVKGEVTKAMEARDYSMEIGLHFEVTRKKDQYLSAFIDKVLDFNRHKTYNKQKCNNHHFLKEAMMSLGIHKPPKLSTSIQEHIKQLKPSKYVSRRQINDHAELDRVSEQLLWEDLPRGDIQYLIAQYFLFHVTDWEAKTGGGGGGGGGGEGLVGRQQQGGGGSDQWKCTLASCKLPDMQLKLKRRTSFSST